MENNKKYAFILEEKGWRNGSGWSYGTTFDSGELEDNEFDNKFVEKVKNGTFDIGDWDDFLKFSETPREVLEADANAEETDIQWEMQIFNIDDYRNGDVLDPVYKRSAWNSDLAKEWLEGLED